MVDEEHAKIEIAHTRDVAVSFCAMRKKCQRVSAHQPKLPAEFPAPSRIRSGRNFSALRCSGFGLLRLSGSFSSHHHLYDTRALKNRRDENPRILARSPLRSNAHSRHLPRTAQTCCVYE